MELFSEVHVDDLSALTAHPAAGVFPMMSAKQFAELKADIEANGLIVPIVLCEGKILDGRNRCQACAELGVPAKFKAYTGDPYAYVWSANGARRDLVNEQKAIIHVLCAQGSEKWAREQEQIRAAANAARSEKAQQQPRETTPAGDTRFGSQVADQNDPPPGQGADRHPSRAALAKDAGVSPGAIGRAQRLVKERPDLAQKVALGEIRPMEAVRQMKRAEVQKKTEALPEGKYRVIYADPPWQYSDKKHIDGYWETGAEDHYPTMATQDICALNVRDLAADDSVLFCWATFPLLPDALKVIAAWGFTYKTGFVWAKGRPNIGNYHRADAELLLLATKGSGVPDEGFVRTSQVHEITREGRHSEKPEYFRELIDQMYKTGPRIELFRRGSAPGDWKVWGNEATDV